MEKQKMFQTTNQTVITENYIFWGGVAYFIVSLIALA